MQEQQRLPGEVPAYSASIRPKFIDNRLVPIDLVTHTIPPLLI
jgi:hypothetical protein